MTTLLNVAVTTAVTAQAGSTFQLRSSPGSPQPFGITAQGTLAGTGGTSMQWWLQTSIDGGTTWCDVMSFTLTPGTVRAVGSVSSSPGSAVVPAAPTDGGMASGAATAIFGNWWRVKYTTLGTFTGGNLRVDAFTGGLVPAGVGA